MVNILVIIALLIVAVWVVVSALLVPALWQEWQKSLVRQELWERNYNKMREMYERETSDK